LRNAGGWFLKKKKTLPERLLGMLYPRCCPVCHKILADQEGWVCPGCRAALSPIQEPRCKKCGRPVGQTEEFCGDCRRIERHFTEGVSVFRYDTCMRTSVLKFKYGGRREYADFYAHVMTRFAEKELRRWHPDVIVPIPLHQKKKRRRGFNQAELLAEKISGESGIPFSSSILVKKRNTHSQKELDERTRRANLKKAFSVQREILGLRILLVDDVFTTGSTMDAAAMCLREAGAETVFFLTLCTAIRDDGEL
jgi:ComF family protein